MNVWTRFQAIRLARRRVKRIFHAEPETPVGDLVDASEIQGAIELDGVSFRYDEDGPDVVSGADIRIAAGECVAITGGNCSGRSTLLGLMLGSLRATDGTVLIDGHDVRSFDPSELKSEVAFLPEHGEVFKGSIMENITMFDDSLTDRAIEVAIALGLDRVVDSMPMGWDTVIGDAATESLPPGIKQRIAIARGFVTDPKVLLFDEANTAIDGTGDTKLREGLIRRKGTCTMVLITYRPSLIKIADSVYEFSDQKLVRKPAEDQSASMPPAAKPEASAPQAAKELESAE